MRTPPENQGPFALSLRLILVLFGYYDVSKRILLRWDLPLRQTSADPISFGGLFSPFALFLTAGLFLSILLIFSPLLQGGTTHLAGMINRLLILSLVSIYLLSGIRKGSFACPVTKIGPAVLAYLGLAIMGAIMSPYTEQSFQWLAVLLSYALLLYILACFFLAWNGIAWLVLVVVGMAIFEAAFAIVQGGLWKIIRPSGTFFNPNFLSGYLGAVCTIVLSCLCYLHAGRWNVIRTSSFARMSLMVCIGVLVLLLIAIVWTGSRGGLLAMLLGVTLVLALRFGRKGLIVLMLVVALGILIPNSLHERFRTEHIQNPVGYARWHIWQASVRGMVDHPLGVGLGLYQYIYPRYAFPAEGQIVRYGKVAQTAHNEYLQMGVELGVAGVLVFWWGIIVVFREVRWILKQRLRRWQRGFVVGAAGATVGILAHAAVDSNLHEPALAIVLTLCVGIILSVRRLTDKERRWFIIPIKSRAIWTALSVLVIGILAVGVLKLGLAWTAYERGSRAFSSENLEEAIAKYQLAVALDPGKALYHSAIAAAYFQMFERSHEGAMAQAAIDELKSAITLNPLDARLSALLGHVYASRASSMRLARTSLDFSYHTRDLWVHAAIASYERAIALEPFAPFYLLELGRLHRLLDNQQTASAYVKRAVEVEPNFLPGRVWLAHMYLELHQPEAALREYAEILDRQERYRGWNANELEMRFLKVDVTPLAAVFGNSRSGA